MADKKITELTALTLPAMDDLLAIVDDTSGNPITKKITLDNLLKIAQVTQTLYVDGNRTDSYIENGSITKPFKTIQAAIAAASGDTLINVAPGTYDGDIDLGLHVVSIRGSGLNATIFTGNITAGDRAHTLEEFRIENTGSLTITDNIFAQNLHLQCAVTVSGSGFLEGKMLLIAPISGVVPLTINSTGGVVLTGSNITAIGDIHAIHQIAGTLVIFHSYIVNSSLANAVINSANGVCGLIDMTIGNSGFGVAISMDNDGSALQANTLNGIVCSGNIVCGTATTYVEGLNFVGFGALSGSALIYKPASRINNDSSVTGDTVKDALNNLNWVTVPANASASGIAGQRAYDASYLYICIAADTWRRIAHETWV